MSNPCSGCAYEDRSMHSCDYIFYMDHHRPCPPGKDCTVKKLRRRRYFLPDHKNVGWKKPAWDVEEGKRLWQAGIGDAEIARRLSTTKLAVAHYKSDHWKKEMKD